MNKILGLALLALASSSVTVAAPARSLDSLNDLPSTWTGVSGDWATKVPAQLAIKRILSVKRISSEYFRVEASYEIEGTLSMGNGRTVPLKTVVFRSTRENPQNAELTFLFNDELIHSLVVLAAYDEASDEFLMRDYLDRGIRHFFLHGKK